MAEEFLASKGSNQPEMSMYDFCKEVIDDPQRFATNHVIKVVHRKRERDLENEFLVVYVLHGNETIALRIERGVNTTIPAAGSSKPLGSDRVAHWVPPPPNSTTLNTYEIGTLRCRAPIKLRNFCLVLRTVYSAKPSYNLPEHQSFVFCSVLMNVVEQELDVHQLDEGPSYDLGGTYGRVKVLDQEIAAKSMQDFRDQAEQDLEEDLEQAIVCSIERLRLKKEEEQATAERALADALTARIGKQSQAKLAEEEAAEGVLSKIGERVKERLALDKMEPASRAIALALSNHKDRGSGGVSQPVIKRLNPGGAWERDEARETSSIPRSPREAYASLQTNLGRCIK